MASGSRGTPMPSRYECHRQPALARSSGLVLKLSRRSKHSASDIQAVPQLVGLEQCRARLCQRPGHRQSACEAKGETLAGSDGTLTSVTINIAGSNDAATLSADVRDLTEANTAAAIS